MAGVGVVRLRSRLAFLLAAVPWLLFFAVTACERPSQVPQNLVDGGSILPASPNSVLGPEGGRVDFGEAAPGLRLDVPAGALSGTIELTAGVAGRPLPGHVGPVFDLGPNGTKFEKPVVLRSTLRPEFLAQRSRLSWATVEKGRWVQLPSRLLPGGVVEGTTLHFSSFGLIETCHASGTQSTFALAGCPTFDPTIETDVPVTLDATAGSISVVLRFSPTGTSTTAQVTVSGLKPNDRYTKYQDSFVSGEPLVSTGSGQVVFSQDVSARHTVLLQWGHASTSLTSATCVPPLGSWSPASNTCTLLRDVDSISIDEDGFNLDCANHRVGDDTTRLGMGILSVRHTGISVLNCHIYNADYGLFASEISTLRMSNIRVESPPSGAATSMAIALGNGTGVQLRDITAENCIDGIESAWGQNLVIERASLALTSQVGTVIGVHLWHEAGTSITDLNVTLPPTPNYGGTAVAMYGSTGVSLTRANLHDMQDRSGVQMFEGSSATLRQTNISGANPAVWVDASVIDLSESTLTQGGFVLQFTQNTTPSLVYHNNIYGNMSVQVLSDAPLELSDARPGSPTFGEGNYWGRSCPGPLFALGIDSIRGDVVDSHPYALPDSWNHAGTPGCAQTAQPLPPVILLPVVGTFTNDPWLQVSGQSVPGASVEVFANGRSLGLGTADAAGDFTVQSPTPLADGEYALLAYATVGSLVSSESDASYVFVDTLPPLPPNILSPASGSTSPQTAVLVFGTAEPFATVALLEGATGLGSTEAGAEGAFTAQVAGPLLIGPHTFSATATDRAGNVSPRSAGILLTIADLANWGPLTTPNGLVKVVRILSAPKPLIPGSGNPNVLRLETLVDPPANSTIRPKFLILRREIRDPATNELLSVAETSARIPDALHDDEECEPGEDEPGKGTHFGHDQGKHNGHAYGKSHCRPKRAHADAGLSADASEDQPTPVGTDAGKKEKDDHDNGNGGGKGGGAGGKWVSVPIEVSWDGTDTSGKYVQSGTYPTPISLKLVGKGTQGCPSKIAGMCDLDEASLFDTLAVDKALLECRIAAQPSKPCPDNPNSPCPQQWYCNSTQGWHCANATESCVLTVKAGVTCPNATRTCLRKCTKLTPACLHDGGLLWTACTAPTETCNGIDDDCDGWIDEDNICQQNTSCCTPTNCEPGQTGCHPDGCTGALVDCGGCAKKACARGYCGSLDQGCGCGTIRCECATGRCNPKTHQCVTR